MSMSLTYVQNRGGSQVSSRKRQVSSLRCQRVPMGSSVTAVMPVRKKTKPDDPEDKHVGWVFADPNGEPSGNTSGLGGPFPASYHENEPEPFYSCKTIRELYDKAGDTDGKYTVPILWDKKNSTIVSNE
jgi:putative glutathione S-transferase